MKGFQGLGFRFSGCRVEELVYAVRVKGDAVFCRTLYLVWPPKLYPAAPVLKPGHL